MKNIQTRLIPTILLTAMLFKACDRPQHEFRSDWHQQPDRVWIGQDYWANRLQDWRIENGKLICVNTAKQFRDVHILTHRMGEEGGTFEAEITFGLHPEASNSGANGWAGLLLGAGEDTLDYRGSAMIHYSPGAAGGLIVGINEFGQVVFLDNTLERENIGSMAAMPDIGYPDSIVLKVDLYPGDDSLYTIAASAIHPVTREVISSNTLTKVYPSRILGNIAIASNHLEDTILPYGYWFSRFRMHGDKLDVDPSRRFGPVMGVQYTLHRGQLKLTAQLAPIGEEDEQHAELWTRELPSGTWHMSDSVDVRRDAFIAPFSVKPWDASLEHEYRVVYRVTDYKGRKRAFYYTGNIAPDPVDKEKVVAGAFACMSHSHGNINGSRFDYPDRLWFPHSDYVESVSAQEPDILFFLGDQVYEARPTGADWTTPEHTELDYLYKWYIFLWTTGELTRDIPTVSIPDDHDVYHGNLWGAGGRKAPAFPEDSIYPPYYDGFRSHWQQDQGGYKLRASSVNMIQATQTSHLPDPYDPVPVEQDIGVYYTDLNYGRISFAILEDRKFKSAPSVRLPEARVVNGFAQNRYISGRRLDDPDAVLLGERQLDFIDAWTQDWKGSDFKVSISQTIFANLSTYPDTFKTDAGTPALSAPKPGVIPDRYRVAKDMDSNGWPQTGRNRALSALRKGFTTMIGGDQHLGSLIHMGVERWDDAGYSFCVPAVGNLWPRRWFPPSEGLDHIEGMPAYTGKYFDGFGNRMTVWAVANPVQTGMDPASLYDRAVGYGIIRFDKPNGTITFECWKRDADPEEGETGMYTGWPKTISILENYERPARSWLPTFIVSGLDHHPVFQIVQTGTGEIIYTVRVPGNEFQPPVFDVYGTEYTIRIGDPDRDTFQVIENIASTYRKNEEVIEVEF
jgi:hypothetical protein